MNHESNATETIATETTALLEIPMKDQNGEDLGSYSAESSQTIGELIEEVVEESGLPVVDVAGRKRRYEGYAGGRKLSPTTTVKEARLRPGEAVEIYPSIMTGIITGIVTGLTS